MNLIGNTKDHHQILIRSLARGVNFGDAIIIAQDTSPHDEELYECDDDEEVFLVKYYEV